MFLSVFMSWIYHAPALTATLPALTAHFLSEVCTGGYIWFWSWNWGGWLIMCVR